MNTNTRTHIRVEAFDTLFFRDGKPFTMGAETWADMMFPPSPSVIYGALRGQYFGEHFDKLPLARTTNDPTASLCISALALHNGDELLFPLPCDYVTRKGANDHEGLLLQQWEDTPMSNARVRHLIIADPNQVVDTEEHGLLDGDQLEQYLAGQADSVFYKTLDDYTVLEPKLGIERKNDTHITTEGRLYRVAMHRLEPQRKFGQVSENRLYLQVCFSDLPLAPRGVFRLGGEGKMAAYYPAEVSFPAAPSLCSHRFKLYLATPALFRHGWLPEWVNPKTLEAVLPPPCNGITGRLDTAILGKPFSIGGFWMKTRQHKAEPKMMRQAVPAGSVYYFTMNGDISDTQRQQVLDLFHGHCISDYEKEQGFGLSYVGEVQI